MSEQAAGSLAELLAELRGRPLAEARAVGRDRLPGSGSFEARAAALGARAATALAALHAVGRAHGNVRASSIRLGAAGEVLLGCGPWGCAEEAAGAPQEERAAKPSVEEARAGKSSPGKARAVPSAAGDVLALGEVLYELMALRAPSRGDARGVAAPRAVQPFLSSAAERVLLHALEPRVERRPSAAALARDLLALAAGAPVAAPERGPWRRALCVLRGGWRTLVPG